MPIDDDRQSKLNNINGSEKAVWDALDALTEDTHVPALSADALDELAEAIAKDEAHASQTSRIDIASPAARLRGQKNRAEHEHAKVHGFKARRNRAIDDHRKTDAGKADRAKEEREKYWNERGSQGHVVRPYVTGLDDEAKAKHRTGQVATAVTKHRDGRSLEKIKADKEAAAQRARDAWAKLTPAEKDAKNKARAARRAKAKKS